MRLFLLTFLTILAGQGLAQDYYMLVGTYDSPLSEGIYVFRFNSQTGVVSSLNHIKASNPSFLTVSPDEQYVYAVFENARQGGAGGEVAAYKFDKQTGSLMLNGKQDSGGDHPCHVELDNTGRWIFVSNYSSGSLSVLPVQPGGGPGLSTTIQHTGSGPDPQRQKAPHVHGAYVTPDNRQLLVTDLGTDRVMIYDFDQVTGTLKPSAQPYVASIPGSGPRSLALHPNSRWIYAVEELSGTLSGYDYSNGRLEPAGRVSLRVEGDTRIPGSADIHISPDGKFLYASNRGEMNNIVIYRIGENGQLERRGEQSVLGNAPRHFSIDPTGRFLLSANQNSNEIVVFRRDPETGLLSDTHFRVGVGKPVCIKWIGIK